MSRSTPLSSWARRALCAGIAACAGAALAQPTGLSVVHGGATISQSGNTTTITTVNGAGTQHSALDWTTFGVPGGKTVYFAQPNAQSTSINRVLGGDPSAIDGTLGSNGRLVLVNPAGIAFGHGAVVDTAAFIASTLPMSRDDAIAGRLRFGGATETDDDHRPKLQVEGHVLARNGDVVLIGPDIEAGSSAVIEANAGDVLIAAGRAVEVTGRGLEGIHLTVQAPQDQAINLGTLSGDSVAIFAGNLRHSGLVQASSVTESGGKVVLQALDQAEVDGRIQATNSARGGSVWITGNQLALKSAASIDVSHAHGGGEILVGGGWQGADTRIANASETDVDKGVQLKADATLSGNGGTVVVWSDRKTAYAGSISARGAGDGHGGQVEVSSAGRLEYKGHVDVGAGRSGGTGKGDASGGAANANDGADSGGPLVVPLIPLQAQAPQVQSDVGMATASNASYLAAGASLLAPESARLAASGVADAADLTNQDALRVLGGAAAPGGDRRARGVVVTKDACRLGS